VNLILSFYLQLSTRRLDLSCLLTFLHSATVQQIHLVLDTRNGTKMFLKILVLRFHRPHTLHLTHYYGKVSFTRFVSSILIKSACSHRSSLSPAFASVLIPGGTINIIVRASRFAMTRSAFSTIPAGLKTWAPTFSGLGSIPFIVHPIDGFVDFVMDNTTRQWFKGYS